MAIIPTYFAAGKTKLVVHILPGDGFFKVSENETLLTSGYISVLDTSTSSQTLPVAEEAELTMSQADVYKDLRLRGYNYGPLFQGIVKATCEGQ